MRQYKWVLVNILNNKDLDVLVVNEIHFEWPACKICGFQMQFQGKIATDLGLELIFMCTNV